MSKDANIVVTFSQPMNQAATQAAYQSTDIPAGGVTFGWNVSGMQMTINPNADLVYVATTDPNAAPKKYSFTLTNAATDLAGNRLASTNSSFSTLKVVTSTFTSTDALTQTAINTGAVTGGVVLNVGDNDGNSTLRGFVSFDIASLPSALTGGRILGAKLHYYALPSLGSPFEDLATCPGGAAGICTHLIIESVIYGSELGSGDFDAPALRAVRSYRQGRIQEPPFGSNAVDVLTSVQDDLDNRVAREGRSQFRYRFAKLTDADHEPDTLDVAKTGPNKPSLEVVYLYP